DSPGGLCSELLHVYYEGRWAHFAPNTGAITLRHPNGRRFPIRESQLTLAHELGHSLGAVHDDETEDWKDDHLMTATQNIYETKNRSTFSRQSIDQISAVLDALESYEPYDPSGKTVHRIKKNCLQ
ncbi:hypothetical protein PRIPAC_86059, partial [Pristionchus pacificus]